MPNFRGAYIFHGFRRLASNRENYALRMFRIGLKQREVYKEAQLQSENEQQNMVLLQPTDHYHEKQV